MQENVSFQIGKVTSDFLKIEIERYAYPKSNDFWDGNWLDTIISINTGPFSARYDAQLRNTDFLDLRKGLEQLYINLNGEAKFSTMESYIEIKIHGDGLGHFLCNCSATNDSGIYGSRLDFNLDFDQTEIPELIKSINIIIENFPVKEIDKYNKN